ncbi:MAG: GNAT family N-acetyltransferase [Mycobacteriales bacterium]
MSALGRASAYDGDNTRPTRDSGTLSRMEVEEATARCRLATYAVWRAEALVHGGEVAVIDGVQMWHTGVPVGYWNGAHVTAVPVEPERTLRRVPDWFAERKMPYGVLVPVELEPAMAAAAGATGLQLAKVQPCMTLAAADYTPPAHRTAGLEVRRTGPADVEDFLAVQVGAFAMDPATARDFLAPPIGQPGWIHLTGYVGGVPVASAIGVRTSDAVGVYGVGTTQGARRRGFGAALTAHLLTDAFSSGAALAHLNPTEMGAGVYGRLGFRDVPGFAIWLPAGTRSATDCGN